MNENSGNTHRNSMNGRNGWEYWRRRREFYGISSNSHSKILSF